jgi:glycosyltransferase involved in cell wall biosynthesis
VHDNLLHEEIQPINPEKLRVLYVGRVSREKNIAALCQYENDFEITVVGNGPHFEELNEAYKKVQFIGYKFGEELAKIYAQHDVFAFPSHTDTFGIVMIEAMCNGLPVAGYNVAGPKDVIQQGVTGVVGDDLYPAIIACKSLDRAKIKRDSLAKWSWDSCFDIFTKHLDAK